MLVTQRQEEQEWKDQLKQQMDEQMPKATEEKKQAIVMKTMYQEKHKKQDFGDSHELSFKPQFKTFVSNKKRVYHHTGKWEKSKFEDQEAWSC